MRITESVPITYLLNFATIYILLYLYNIHYFIKKPHTYTVILITIAVSILFLFKTSYLYLQLLIYETKSFKKPFLF